MRRIGGHYAGQRLLSEFHTFVAELFQGLGPVRCKRMFGGAGVYCDGRIFGLVIDDVLYLRADKTTKPVFEAEGSAPFVYEAKGRQVVVGSYFRAPDLIFDDPEEASRWGRMALAAERPTPKAKRSRASKHL